MQHSPGLELITIENEAALSDGLNKTTPVRVGASSAARNPGRHLPCQSGQLPCVV